MATESNSSTAVVGSGSFRYEPVENWQQLPAGWDLVEAVGVAVDSRDRVYVFSRGEHPIVVFDADGKFLHAWGEGKFDRPHGIWIGPDDSLYLSDDRDHTVSKYTTEGELLLKLGTSGQPSETGVENFDYRMLRGPAEPFNLPTNLALSSTGDMFVTDGYGNCRVHRFSPEGKLLLSWGEPGDGPGQFHLPHGIGIDGNDRIFVADRENCRLQLFTTEGEFIEDWTDLARPCEVFIDRDNFVFVAELGWRAGMFPWMTADPTKTGGRLSIFNSKGELQARWGGGDTPCAPGDFFAPHDLWIDSQGSLYVGEVTMSAGGYDGVVPPDCHTLQKFVKQ